MTECHVDSEHASRGNTVGAQRTTASLGSVQSDHLAPRGDTLAHGRPVRRGREAVTPWAEQVAHPAEYVQESLRRHR